MADRQWPSLDVLGTDEELTAQARDQQQYEGTEAEGWDETRSVIVAVDLTGRVVDVTVSSYWRDHLSPAGLAEGMFGAYAAAYDQAARALTPPDGDPPHPPRPAGTDALDLSDGEWLTSVRRRLAAARDTLTRVDELAGAAPEQRTVTGPDRIVTLLTTGAAVTGVEIDVHAALRETSGRIAADALAAFRAVR